MATISHQAIREVQEAFNAGRLQLEIDFDYKTEDIAPADAAKRFLSQQDHPDITLAIQQRRDPGQSSVVLVVHKNGATTKMSI